MDVQSDHHTIPIVLPIQSKLIVKKMRDLYNSPINIRSFVSSN